MATVPKLTLTVNHASGAGYYAMAGQGFDPDFILSLPTGRMGVMEGESAVVALLGLSFKPETDDMRESAAIPLVTALIDAGAEVRAFDPVAMATARLLLPDPVCARAPRRCECRPCAKYR